MNDRRPRRKGRPILTSPVDELQLNTRASNALYFAKIRTVGDLLAHRPTDLLRFWNIGRTTRLIEQAVRKAKFRWKD
jgi:DNA-directed RNA polymerase alpha subunit